MDKKPYSNDINMCTHSYVTYPHICMHSYYICICKTNILIHTLNNVKPVEKMKYIQHIAISYDTVCKQTYNYGQVCENRSYLHMQFYDFEEI